MARCGVEELCKNFPDLCKKCHKLSFYDPDLEHGAKEEQNDD